MTSSPIVIVDRCSAVDLIGQFISRYTREYDYYDQVGRLARVRLELVLQEEGIRAIVTSRAKSISRLREKCVKRDSERPYSSVEQIYESIADLAGVRVALYFPGERKQVEAIISRIFQVIEPRREFPDSAQRRPDNRFTGYSAVHYRVRLQEHDLAEPEQRYGLARIEIQIASVLMHAWSEVEHDLDYKPQAGTLSADEYAILDQLNGLVLAGEIALERLQEAGRRRVTVAGGSFANHYDLANYLLSHAAGLVDQPISDAGVGRVDLLFELLSRTNMRDSRSLAPYIEALHGDLERRPLAEQLIDALIDQDPEKYQIYQNVRFRASGGMSETDERIMLATGRFLGLWNDLERLLRDTAPADVSRPLSILSLLRRAHAGGLVSDSLASEIDIIRRIRNEVVHGGDIPSAQTLDAASQHLSEIIVALRKSIN